MQKSHFNPGEREEKPTEHHFELEPTSFPPLPGSTVSITAAVRLQASAMFALLGVL